MSRRTERVNHTLREELGLLITGMLRDPRLPAVTSVTAVTCSPDFSEASVLVSILAKPEEQQQAITVLNAASGLLRRELAGKVRMRHIPRLTFRLDTLIQEGADMLALIDRVAAADRRASRDAPAPGPAGPAGSGNASA
jgi:ribosome-binding factor A